MSSSKHQIDGIFHHKRSICKIIIIWASRTYYSYKLSNHNNEDSDLVGLQLWLIGCAQISKHVSSAATLMTNYSSDIQKKKPWMAMCLWSYVVTGGELKGSNSKHY
jgi:hypothetical protein